MATSQGFEQLHPLVQHFIWTQGWSSLRDVQEQAIEPVLRAEADVVIAAETAAGKTEAAFLPAISNLLFKQNTGLIVYVSPIKALINDQFGRLSLLCEQAELRVWPWHGDVSSGLKAKFVERPSGILLITPESLEALLCNRGSQIARVFANVEHIIVDELHAFIGSERGKQLQSLMHRIELLVGKRIPRIGLSATLGDMELAARYLRPGKALPTLVQAKGEGSSLKLIIKGYEEPIPDAPLDEVDLSELPDNTTDDEEDEPESVSPGRIAQHLFQATLGSNNLIFPNSRQQVERYTVLLNKLCAAEGRSPEYWPHHGSLSKDMRADTEAALKQRDRTANAVCTNTLELGIDIGSVRSVAQIGTPYSVAGLRQRLGRSGRRAGESKILRGYVIEVEQAGARDLPDVLRLETVQLAAMVRLLVGGWFEPPEASRLHYSTLIQQLLSLVAQQGGVTAGEAFRMLCGPAAPFEGISKADFVSLLKQLGKLDLLVQDSSGALLHGVKGERFVNHYSFYAAFKAEEEFRLITGEKTLGSLPVATQLKLGQKFLFGGMAWRIESIDIDKKTIHVSRAKGGAPPLYVSGRGSIHGRVREEMRKLLEETAPCDLLDTQGKAFLQEGRQWYLKLGLAHQKLLAYDGTLHVMTWQSDAVNTTLAAYLQSQGFAATAETVGVAVVLGMQETDEVVEALRKGSEGLPSLAKLLEGAATLEREKWDWALPLELLQKSYASAHLALPECHQWLRNNFATA